MTAAEIKALPKEFDFKSNISSFDLVYHAIEEKHCYVVTHDDCKWKYDKKEFRRSLLNNDFVVYKNTVFDAIKQMNKGDREMSREQAIKYLTNVVNAWSAFCKEHSRFALAIKVLIAENGNIKE